MRESHKHMPITKKEFDGVWRHMEMAYRKHKVSEDLVREVKEVVYSTFGEIVNK